MKKKDVLHKGTASELYLVIGLTANMGTANADRFGGFNQKYTPAFFEALKAAADDAQAMPDHSDNQAIGTQLRNAVIGANNNVCLVFGTLIGYIRNSFAANDVDTMKKLAGSDWYADAIRQKWSSVSFMIGKAESFIDGHSAELTAGGMPEDFPATVSDSGDAFNTALTTFNVFKGAAAGSINAKIAANNDVYNRTQAILKDGKIVFAGDAAMKKQCSYTAQLKKVKGPGRSGFRIALKAVGTQSPITTANITFMPTGKWFVADEKGIIENALPEGVYSYTLTAPGYATAHGTLKISAGVVRHKKIEMTTAAALEATA